MPKAPPTQRGRFRFTGEPCHLYHPCNVGGKFRTRERKVPSNGYVSLLHGLHYGFLAVNNTDSKKRGQFETRRMGVTCGGFALVGRRRETLMEYILTYSTTLTLLEVTQSTYYRLITKQLLDVRLECVFHFTMYLIHLLKFSANPIYFQTAEVML